MKKLLAFALLLAACTKVDPTAKPTPAPNGLPWSCGEVRHKTMRDGLPVECRLVVCGKPEAATTLFCTPLLPTETL